MSLHSLLLSSCCLGWLLTSSVLAQPATEDPAEAAQTVILPLDNGGLDSKLLFEAVADDLHWIAGGVAGFTRLIEGSDSQSYLTPTQVEKLVREHPEVFQYADLPGSTTPGLAVDVDEFARRLADKKSSLRSWLSRAGGTPLSKLTKLPKTWPDNALSPLRIVVVSAGLHSPTSSATAVAEELHARTNLPMCVFSYPNDGPIRDSSAMLLKELESLHAEYPASRVTLITHSMGGLVARGMLELTLAEDLDSRSRPAERLGVDQLIQICPPNHGSALAQYGPLLEGVEQVYRLVDRRSNREQRILLGMITDGFNEASADLAPDSRFLLELNRAQREPAVRYTILAGNNGPLRPMATTLLGSAWDRVANALEEPIGIDARVREVLECDELQRGKGDGVVALQSALLDGVVDVQVLPIHHLTWNELDSEEAEQLLREITSRLGISL